MGDARDSSKPAMDRAVRQISRKLPEWGDLEVVALIASDGVYFPLKLLSFVFLGDVNDRAQRARVQRDQILRELTRVYPVETPGGRQQMVCLERLGIGRWINGVDISRLRPEIRERFLAFQWELTRLADRLLFGEASTARPADSQAVARLGASHRESRRPLSDEDLLSFLHFLARRVGTLEMDVSQVKKIQAAILGAGDSDAGAQRLLPGDEDTEDGAK
jgi:hypothetical protein